MENCLVTKLKGSVHNDNLPYFEGFIINVHASENMAGDPYLFFINPIEGKTVTLKAIGGGYIDDGAQQLVEITIPHSDTGSYLHFANANFKVLITRTYDIASISGANDDMKSWSIDLSQVNKFNTDIYLGLFGVPSSGEVSYLGSVLTTTEGVDASVINLDKVGISDNFSSLKKHTNVSGSIRVFDNKIHASEISMPFLGNVTGEVKDLLDAQVANGRTSNTLSLQLAGTGCTLNGTLITYESLGGHWNIIVTFDSSAQGGYTIEYT